MNDQIFDMNMSDVRVSSMKWIYEFVINYKVWYRENFRGMRNISRVEGVLELWLLE